MGQRTDVLSVLIGAHGDSSPTDRQLRDELLDLYLGGYVPTADALARAFERLLHEPAALAHLRTSIRSGDNGHSDAVIHETLRLRPPFFAAGRRLARPATIARYPLPARTCVAAAISLIQRSPRWHDQPDAFRPERFTNNANHRTWIPFGGGPRRCIGAQLTTLELSTVLHTVLSQVDLAPATRNPERTRPRTISTIPAKGALAIVRQRLTESSCRGEPRRLTFPAAASSD